LKKLQIIVLTGTLGIATDEEPQSSYLSQMVLDGNWWNRFLYRYSQPRETRQWCNEFENRHS